MSGLTRRAGDLAGMVNTRPKDVVLALVETLLAGPSDVETVVSCARALVCCGEARLAAGLAESLAGQGVARTAIAFELLMRLETQLGQRIEDPRRVGLEGHSEWANTYKYCGEDIIYPADLVDMLVVREGGGHRFVFLDRCRSCGRIGKLDPLSETVEHGRYLCPHCLARKDFSEEGLREAASRSYLNLLGKLEGRVDASSPDGAGLGDFMALTRALKPIVLVRYGCMRTTRIGHMAVQHEVYLAERDIGLRSTRTLDVFGWDDKVCNHRFLDMWRRTLPTSPLGQTLWRLFAASPGGGEHVIPGTRGLGRYGVDTYAALEQTPPHLRFTPAEESAAAAERTRMGLPEGAPYICFYARDPAYLAEIYPDIDCSYHDFRNADINNCLAAAQALVRKGYHALRMGSVVARPLETASPGIIDYATRYRSELMDIHLLAHCRFFLSGGSGIDAVATIFRKPIVYVNWIPLRHADTVQRNAVIIFKLLWSRAEKRFLTFREIFASELLSSFKQETYERHGLDVVENSPDEILDAALEMEARLDGTWEPQAGDEERQQRFWDYFKPICPGKRPAVRIGAAFLRKYPQLFD